MNEFQENEQRRIEACIEEKKKIKGELEQKEVSPDTRVSRQYMKVCEQLNMLKKTNKQPWKLHEYELCLEDID